MKFFKKHKKEAICLIALLVILLILLTIFIIMWFGGSKNKYGTRLEGIENVELSDSYLGDIESELKENSIVSSVSSNVQGKIVNFIIVVKDETSVKDAKKLSNIVKEGFTKEELEFYDLEIFVSTSSKQEDTKYPIIGYKHKNSEDFVWSNN